MDTNKLLFGLLSVLVAISMAIAGFALKWQFVANAEIKVIQHQLSEQSEQVQIDLKHSSQLSKHWKLHGWAKDEINKLRAKHGLELESWPDLGGTHL